MANTKNSPRQVVEIVILVVVLICTALILTDMTNNLIQEVRAGNPPTATSGTLVPLNGTGPTLDPNAPLPTFIIGG